MALRIVRLVTARGLRMIAPVHDDRGASEAAGAAVVAKISMVITNRRRMLQMDDHSCKLKLTFS